MSVHHRRYWWEECTEVIWEHFPMPRSKRLLAAGTGPNHSLEFTYDSNQWVSFDDGVTRQKISFSNKLYALGYQRLQETTFTLVADPSSCFYSSLLLQWSIDQDNVLAIQIGWLRYCQSPFKEQMANATLQSAVASLSCYWSLCGGSCNSRYFDVTDARGQIVASTEFGLLSG
ncbi:hypothetical protein N7540_011212 [Penicillium herquei]|nr:hypothetical protein N7540_011212 [Penicillium herquei]